MGPVPAEPTSTMRRPTDLRGLPLVPPPAALPSGVDSEVLAIAVCVLALQQVDAEAQGRVVGYLAGRFGVAR